MNFGDMRANKLKRIGQANRDAYSFKCKTRYRLFPKHFGELLLSLFASLIPVCIIPLYRLAIDPNFPFAQAIISSPELMFISVLMSLSVLNVYKVKGLVAKDTAMIPFFRAWIVLGCIIYAVFRVVEYIQVSSSKNYNSSLFSWVNGISVLIVLLVAFVAYKSMDRR